MSEVSAARQFRHLLGHPFRPRLHRRLQCLDDSAALLLALDLRLRLDSEPGTGQLLLGPQCFDGRANLGTLDRDRGVGLQFGTLDLGAGGRTAILACLTTPQLEDQRHEDQQREKHDRRQSHRHRRRARKAVLVHRHPSRAEAVVDVRRRGLARMLQRLVTRGDLGVEDHRPAVAVADGVVQLPLGVGEKVLRRSGFGPGAGHTGDVGLRAGRRRVVLTPGDDESFVALTAGLIHRGVECGTYPARAVEFGRSLRDGGCGVGVADGALIENAVDRA